MEFTRLEAHKHRLPASEHTVFVSGWFALRVATTNHRHTSELSGSFKRNRIFSSNCHILLFTVCFISLPCIISTLCCGSRAGTDLPEDLWPLLLLFLFHLRHIGIQVQGTSLREPRHTRLGAYVTPKVLSVHLRALSSRKALAFWCRLWHSRAAASLLLSFSLIGSFGREL